jgi:hypothetical protein
MQAHDDVAKWTLGFVSFGTVQNNIRADTWQSLVTQS